MTTGMESQSLMALPLLVLGFWDLIANLLPAILGGASGLLGGGSEQLPQPLPPSFPETRDSFSSWLSSQMFQKTDGGYDMFGNQAFQGINGGPDGFGSAQGPGTDLIGQMTPDINSTILPNVYGNWQPWDGGTQYIADAIYNKMPLGQDDPRSNQLMTQGGFGGPGHQGMATAMQYGVPSEAGRYMANLAQFGVTSEPMANFMKQVMQGGLNQYRKAPVPPRSA